MKKLLISIAILVIAGNWCTSVAQSQGKGNQKKEQSQGQDKGKNNKSQGENKKIGNEKSRGQEKNKEVNKERTDGDKGEDRRSSKAMERNPRGKEDVKKIISIQGNDNVFVWDREKFKDRGKIRNEGKVTVCHKFNRTDEHPVTINISRNALKAHLNHGDVQGNCPAFNEGRKFSDIFIGRRTDYYNTLYNAQDQVVYSQSILDYALQRLTGARAQLVVLQNSNAPIMEIERKQAVIVELEDNVSLLESALGVVAGILVTKVID